jgi:hypothetical protein
MIALGNDLKKSHAIINLFLSLPNTFPRILWSRVHFLLLLLLIIISLIFRPYNHQLYLFLMPTLSVIYKCSSIYDEGIFPFCPEAHQEVESPKTYHHIFFPYTILTPMFLHSNTPVSLLIPILCSLHTSPLAVHLLLA